MDKNDNTQPGAGDSTDLYPESLQGAGDSNDLDPESLQGAGDSTDVDPESLQGAGDSTDLDPESLLASDLHVPSHFTLIEEARVLSPQELINSSSELTDSFNCSVESIDGCSSPQQNPEISSLEDSRECRNALSKNSSGAGCQEVAMVVNSFEVTNLIKKSRACRVVLVKLRMDTLSRNVSSDNATPAQHAVPKNSRHGMSIQQSTKHQRALRSKTCGQRSNTSLEVVKDRCKGKWENQDSSEEDLSDGSLYQPSGSDSDVDEEDDTGAQAVSGSCTKRGKKYNKRNARRQTGDGVKSVHDLNNIQIAPTGRKLRINACTFCNELHSRLLRHLFRKHKKEKEVAAMAALPVTSEERKRQFDMLRLKGNYDHNQRVLETGQGSLIVSRRTLGKDVDVSEYVPCPQCLVYGLRALLSRHMQKTCMFRVREQEVDAQVSQLALYDELGQRGENLQRSNMKTAPHDETSVGSSITSCWNQSTLCNGHDQEREDQNSGERNVCGTSTSTQNQASEKKLASDGSDKDHDEIQDSNDASDDGKLVSDPHVTSKDAVENDLHTNSLYVGKHQGCVRLYMYDNWHACLFCKKLVMNVKGAHHLLEQHTNEKAVAFIATLPLKSKERRQHVERLRLKGIFHHNLRVLKRGHGLLLVTQTHPGKAVDANDFAPCPQCLAFVLKRMMSLHIEKKCLSSGQTSIEEVQEAQLALYNDLEQRRVAQQRSDKSGATAEDTNIQDRSLHQPSGINSNVNEHDDTGVQAVSKSSTKRGKKYNKRNARRETADGIQSVQDFNNLRVTLTDRKLRVHACAFCNELHSRLPRHLVRKHKEEQEVAVMLALPATSKERRRRYDMLRLRGNYDHNQRVLETGKGLFIVSRPTRVKAVDVGDYVPCPQCLVYGLKDQLSHHMQKACMFRVHEQKVDVQVTQLALYDEIEQRRVKLQRSNTKTPQDESSFGSFITHCGNQYTLCNEHDRNSRNKRIAVCGAGTGTQNHACEKEGATDSSDEEHDDGHDKDDASDDDWFVSDPHATSEDEVESELNTNSGTTVETRERCVRVDTYDNWHACLFCKKLFMNTEIDHHLLDQHTNDKSVAFIATLPLKSEERRQHVERLRLKGIYHHNRRVLKTGHGLLLVTQRPPGKAVDASEFAPCPRCFGFVLKKMMSLHGERNCLSSQQMSLKVQDAQLALYNDIEQKRVTQQRSNEREGTAEDTSCGFSTIGDQTRVETSVNELDVAAIDKHLVSSGDVHQDDVTDDLCRKSCSVSDGEQSSVRDTYPDDIHHQYSPENHISLQNKGCETEKGTQELHEMAEDESTQMLPSDDTHVTCQVEQEIGYFNPEQQSCLSSDREVDISSEKLDEDSQHGIGKFNPELREGEQMHDADGQNHQDVISKTKLNESRNKHRVLWRYHACFYCKLLQSKIIRHIMRKHAKEREVAEITTLPQSDERINRFRLLISRGDHCHNQLVLARGVGSLIVARRRAGKLTKHSDYAPCPHCFTYLVKSDMTKHWSRGCPAEMEDYRRDRQEKHEQRKLRLKMKLVDQLGSGDGSKLGVKVSATGSHKACFLCQKISRNLSKHFRQHRMNAEIASLANMPHKSLEWKKLFRLLSYRGNHLHNQRVLAKGSGTLFVVTSPHKTLDSSDYEPCPKCLGYFVKADMAWHSQHCPTRMDFGMRRRKKYQKKAERDEDCGESYIDHSDESSFKICSRRHFCLFCKKPQTRMFRHLVRKHSKEAEVAILAMLPPDSTERKEWMAKLRKQGDYNHNQRVLAAGKGTFAVVRFDRKQWGPDKSRPMQISDFEACPHCLAYIQKRHMKIHYNRNHPGCVVQTQAQNSATYQDAFQKRLMNSSESNSPQKGKRRRKDTTETDGESKPRKRKRIPVEGINKRAACVKRPWSEAESDAVQQHLSYYIHAEIVPGMDACNRCIKKSAPILDNRDWRAVKFKVKNLITSQRRKANKQ